VLGQAIVLALGSSTVFTSNDIPSLRQQLAFSLVSGSLPEGPKDLSPDDPVRHGEFVSSSGDVKVMKMRADIDPSPLRSPLALIHSLPPRAVSSRSPSVELIRASSPSFHSHRDPTVFQQRVEHGVTVTECLSSIVCTPSISTPPLPYTGNSVPSTPPSRGTSCYLSVSPVGTDRA
jgi:hypothetical protein